MRAESFADVFDLALKLVWAAPATRFPATAPPPAASPFLFPRPLTTVPPQWARAYPAAPRPAHRLNDAQREAFARLSALGATLPANFTAEDLRREYRQLAWQLHPDTLRRNPGVAPPDQTRAFVAATESYRCLRAVVELRH